MFYGRKHLGAISGLAMAVPICGSALGPWVFSQSLALGGSYRAVSIACLIPTIFLLAASFRANNPQDRLPENATGA